MGLLKRVVILLAFVLSASQQLTGASMIETQDDIWEWHQEGHWICIPTNLGLDRFGHNVMGAGLARQARDRFPKLPEQYGLFCKNRNENELLWHDPSSKLIMFPTKTTWKVDSSLDLIRSTLPQLLSFSQQLGNPVVCLPLLGCGLGNLSKRDVISLLREYLKGSNFVLVMG